MVTQMLAAYLEQSQHPKAQQEILTKMADPRQRMLPMVTPLGTDPCTMFGAEKPEVSMDRPLVLSWDASVVLSGLLDRFL